MDVVKRYVTIHVISLLHHSRVEIRIRSVAVVAVRQSFPRSHITSITIQMEQSTS